VLAAAELVRRQFDASPQQTALSDAKLSKLQRGMLLELAPQWQRVSSGISLTS